MDVALAQELFGRTGRLGQTQHGRDHALHLVLGGAAVTDERAIHVEHGVQQIFVVAGEERLRGVRLAYGLDVARVLVHIALADLERLHVRQSRQVGEELRGVRRAGPRRIDVNDQAELGRFVNGIEIIEAMFGFEAEAQPVMRGHDV